jgi:hypothetical protein
VKEFSQEFKQPIQFSGGDFSDAYESEHGAVDPASNLLGACSALAFECQKNRMSVTSETNSIPTIPDESTPVPFCSLGTFA